MELAETTTDPRKSALGVGKFVFVITAIHLAVALPLAYYLTIWMDEASSLYASEHGFWTAFSNAAVEQKQAPLYFWILSLWREIDGSIFFARLFSILCSVLAIKFFADLTSKIVDRSGTMLLIAFFGLHPFLIWASLEIRVYSLVILLTIFLIRSFFSAFWDRPETNELRNQPYRYLMFLVTTVIALYTNYYLGFLIAGLFVALVCSRRWREAGRFAVLMALAGAAFLPLVFEIAAEFTSKSSGFQPERFVFEGVRIIWHHFLTFVFPTEIFPEAEQSTMSFVRVWVMRVAVIFAAGVVMWKRKKITSLTVSLTAVVVVIGSLLLASYFLIGSEYIHIRHASVLFVPLIVLLASLIRDVWPPTWNDLAKPVQWAVALTFTGLFAYSISVLYPNLTKRGDWARVADFIAQNESPGQPIVVFEPFNALALPYYYRGSNQILPDNNYFDFGLQAPAGTERSLARQNEFVISVLPRDAGSLWLVVDEHCISTDACRPLEKYVESHYTIELEKEFYISKVYLLKAKTP